MCERHRMGQESGRVSGRRSYGRGTWEENGIVKGGACGQRWISAHMRAKDYRLKKQEESRAGTGRERHDVEEEKGEHSRSLQAVHMSALGDLLASFQPSIFPDQ